MTTQILITYNREGVQTHWLVDVKNEKLQAFEAEYAQYNQQLTPKAAFYFNDENAIEEFWHQGSYCFAKKEKLDEIIREIKM